MSRSSRLWLLVCLLGFVFAAWVGAVRLVPFHDDIYNIPVIAPRTILSVFDIRPFGHRDYRPVIAALWLLVRDLTGTFVPALLHWWNVAAHTLASGLVAGLALRISRGQPLNRLVFAAIAVLIFAFFPFSQQAVLWAGAVGHPLMTMFGLMGMHAALSATRRRSVALGGLSAVFLLLACLSHEQGFVFGALIPLVVLGQRWVQRQPWTRWDVGLSVALAVLGAAYAVFYQLAISTVWVGAEERALLRATGLADVIRNLAFNVQAVLINLVVLLRYRLLDVFNDDQVTGLLFGLFVLVIGPALVLMWRWRAWRLPVLALALWGIAAIPSGVYISPGYIEGGPRILYPTVVGIALFWAAFCAVLVQRTHLVAVKIAVGVVTAACVLWNGAFIAERLIELDVFSQQVRGIARDLAGSKPTDRVLFINFPNATGPVDPGPAFLRGNEGVMFHTDFNGTPMMLIATLTGFMREAKAVRHDISLQQNQRYYYLIAGGLIDDTVLRQDLLAANYAFRFDYDGDRPRARLLARLQPDPGDAGGPVLATLQQGDSSVLIRDAQAQVCGRRVRVALTWARATGMGQPAGIFVQGFDAAHQQVFGADDNLISGYLPLELMPPNLALTEFREIELPDGAPVPTEIQAGVYTRDGVRRWTTTRADGQPWDGDAIVVPVMACAITR